MIGSIVLDDCLDYPTEESFFSPSESYPEYPFSHTAPRPNLVYRAVRECLSQAGLDHKHKGSAAWNPLGGYIRPGDRVFLLCNFVYHRRRTESARDFKAKCTHGSVLRAIADYAFIATGAKGSISFGNAPLQSCLWDQVLTDTGAERVRRFYRDCGIQLAARDLRAFVAPRNSLGQIVSTGVRPQEKAYSVALDEQSLLEHFYLKGEKVSFRVSDYDPSKTESYHRWGKHQYLINGEILAADVVISIPKLKTHEKVGITVTAKGFVGCVGLKDCLAHHRVGSHRENGDEYPRDSTFQLALSRFHDFVYRRKYAEPLSPVLESLDRAGRWLSRHLLKRIQSGAWYGNDTAWRMALDVANIVHYADRFGTLQDRVQRTHLSLIDGIIGGEGEGPLAPTAVSSRCLVFADQIALADLIACKLMGYDSTKLPIVDQAYRVLHLPKISEQLCRLNGTTVRVCDIHPALGKRFLPPEGWLWYL